MQTKFHSAIETILNTVIGYIVAIISQLIIFPMFGMYISFTSNLKIALYFSIISIARSYILRRVFNRIGKK